MISHPVFTHYPHRPPLTTCPSSPHLTPHHCPAMLLCSISTLKHPPSSTHLPLPHSLAFLEGPVGGNDKAGRGGGLASCCRARWRSSGGGSAAVGGLLLPRLLLLRGCHALPDAAQASSSSAAGGSGLGGLGGHCFCCFRCRCRRALCGLQLRGTCLRGARGGGCHGRGAHCWGVGRCAGAQCRWVCGGLTLLRCCCRRQVAGVRGGQLHLIWSGSVGVQAQS